MEFALLAPLGQVEREHLLKASPRRTFAKGEVLVHEGDPADSMHLIASGRLAVRVTTRSGDNATLNVLSPGDYFGELSLVRRSTARRRSATIVALERSETLIVTLESFRTLCQRFPGVEQLVIESLAVRVEELSGRLVETMYVGLDQRMFRCLWRMALLYRTGPAGPGAHVPVTIPLTQEQLADLVGGTRPSVNQILQRLAAQGVVRPGRGHIVVEDMARLREKARV